MHYPWWYVPGATAPMLIAFVAVIHVTVAQYAVGGGFLIAFETARAHRTGDAATLEVLRRHVKFFLYVTVVLGAVTGFGIWWAISLASPLATETLTHVFVFAWGLEWMAFLVEILALFGFHYFWGRVSPRTHTRLGWIYAGSAFVSLVIITGILSFQVTPGDWPQDQTFWSAFFNPMFPAQTATRVGGSLLMGALVLYAQLAFTVKDDAVRNPLIQRVARWTLPGVGLIALGGGAWFLLLPPSGKAVVEGTAAMNIFGGLVFAVTSLVMGLMVLGPLRRPRQVTAAFSVALLSLGFIAVATSEFMREATRKPFIITGEVYGHGILADELPEFRREGILRKSVWGSAWAAREYPQLVDETGEVDTNRALDLEPAARIDLGRGVFMHHCNDCHALNGYAGVHGLLRGWEPDMTLDLVTRLDRYHYFMPPWSGSDAELQLIRDYLVSITPPHPMQAPHGPR